MSVDAGVRVHGCSCSIYRTYLCTGGMEAEKRHCSIAASPVGLKGAWIKVLHDGPGREREREPKGRSVCGLLDQFDADDRLWLCPKQPKLQENPLAYISGSTMACTET